MTFSVQSELPPSHQLLLEHTGEGVFQGEGEELSSPPKEERPKCTDRERQSKRSQLSSACSLPAESPLTMTGKNGKKSNHRHWKTWCRAQHAKPQQTGQEVICSVTASFCTETAAAASRGLPEPTPSSPQPQQNLPGLQLHLQSLSANRRTTKSPGVRQFALSTLART